jgi:hypothetical protein
VCIEGKGFLQQRTTLFLPLWNKHDDYDDDVPFSHTPINGFSLAKRVKRFCLFQLSSGRLHALVDSRPRFEQFIKTKPNTTIQI